MVAIGGAPFNLDVLLPPRTAIRWTRVNHLLDFRGTDLPDDRPCAGVFETEPLPKSLPPLLRVAVVKVPPLMGCVKYKAQDVVLAVGIPLFMMAWRTESRKNPRFCCGFSQIEAQA